MARKICKAIDIITVIITILCVACLDSATMEQIKHLFLIMLPCAAWWIFVVIATKN